MKKQDTTEEPKKRILEGVVVRKSGDKTVAVEVAREVRHRMYRKNMKRTKRYLAHDADNSAELGSTVSIQESRPHSKRKRWQVLKSEK